MLNYGDDYDPNRYDADLPEQQPGPGAAPASAPERKRYNTTANWQDPYNPPSPGDPYYAEWWAANKDAGFPAPQAATGTSTTLPSGGARTTDPAQIRAWVDWVAGAADADPSLKADPDYWVRRITETGGLGSDNLEYWNKAAAGPTAFFRNPNRESGGGNLSNDTRAYDDDWFSQNTPAPASYASLTRPDYLQGPYVPGQWTETFKAPTEEDLLKDPGYIAGRDAMQQGLERSAAAKGSILSGGFVGKALPRALGEYAGSAYKDLVGRAFDTYKEKYGAFVNNEALKAGARGINENTFQSDSRENQNAYANRYKSYRDTIGDSFDLAKMGLDAALGSRY